MGMEDEVIWDAVSLGVQMFYFKMKNNRRGRVFR